MSETSEPLIQPNSNDSNAPYLTHNSTNESSQEPRRPRQATAASRKFKKTIDFAAAIKQASDARKTAAVPQEPCSHPIITSSHPPSSTQSPVPFNLRGIRNITPTLEWLSNLQPQEPEDNTSTATSGVPRAVENASPAHEEDVFSLLANFTPEDIPLEYLGSFDLNEPAITSMDASEKDIQKPKDFHCLLCGKGFTRQSDLNRHERAHSGETPFACDEPGCDKAFKQRSALTVHTRTHTKEQPFKCEYPDCTARFGDSSALARHRRSHTERRPHQCDYLNCTRSFTRRSGLLKHLASHPAELSSDSSRSGDVSRLRKRPRIATRIEVRPVPYVTAAVEDPEPEYPLWDRARVENPSLFAPKSPATRGPQRKFVSVVPRRLEQSDAELDTGSNRPSQAEQSQSPPAGESRPKESLTSRANTAAMKRRRMAHKDSHNNKSSLLSDEEHVVSSNPMPPKRKRSRRPIAALSSITLEKQKQVAFRRRAAAYTSSSSSSNSDEPSSKRPPPKRSRLSNAPSHSRSPRAVVREAVSDHTDDTLLSVVQSKSKLPFDTEMDAEGSPEELDEDEDDEQEQEVPSGHVPPFEIDNQGMENDQGDGNQLDEQSPSRCGPVSESEYDGEEEEEEEEVFSVNVAPSMSLSVPTSPPTTSAAPVSDTAYESTAADWPATSALRSPQIPVAPVTKSKESSWERATRTPKTTTMGKAMGVPSSMPFERKKYARTSFFVDPRIPQAPAYSEVDDIFTDDSEEEEKEEREGEEVELSPPSVVGVPDPDLVNEDWAQDPSIQDWIT